MSCTAAADCAVPPAMSPVVARKRTYTFRPNGGGAGIGECSLHFTPPPLCDPTAAAP
eukprot:gene11076-3017_t